MVMVIWSPPSPVTATVEPAAWKVRAIWSFCYGLVRVKTISFNWANLISSKSKIGSQILKTPHRHSLHPLGLSHYHHFLTPEKQSFNRAAKLFASVEGGNLI
jgi:hypothetical protein